jgi:adenylyltransferase/sulfurtransferase
MVDRYSRQILFPGIGKEGQDKLAGGSAVIIGCGALGTVIATILVRSGIGNVRIVDRDFIEYHNLQRQVLFDEDDVRNNLPKAIAAERHLKRVNSSIRIEGIVADVNYTNIERFIRGANVVLDGLDNFETRFLINDACMKHNIPWIYGGAISSMGMTATIIPGKTPCFRCLWDSPDKGGMVLTCDTTGVISPAPFIIASLQSVQAIKVMIGADKIDESLIIIDVWDQTLEKFRVEPRSDCPACQGKFEFLEASSGTKATSLCGQNAVQVINPNAGSISFGSLAEHLASTGEVSYNEFMLRFAVDDHEMFVFPDGRAIVKNTSDESLARGLYAKYIGA